MSTATLINPLSVACPNKNCKAEVDEMCKSKAGTPTKIAHRGRVALANGGVLPAKPTRKKTTRTRSNPKTTVTHKGINSATIGEFVGDLEQLREKWGIAESTNIGVVDPESGCKMAATYDSGAWLVTVSAN